MASAILLVAVLCIPSQVAAEATVTQATFRAAAASWVSDHPGLGGKFVGLYNRLDVSDDGEAAISDSSFTIRAQYARVEVDIADHYFDSTVIGGPLPPYGELLPLSQVDTVHTQVADFTHVHISGSESKPTRFLYVFPLEGSVAHMETRCASARPGPQDPSLAVPGGPDRTVLRAESRVDRSRLAPQADVSHTLEVNACAGHLLSVAGSFLVVLWAWNADVEGKEGGMDLQTGDLNSTWILDGSDNRPHLGTAQQAYIYVENGVFSIDGNDERPTHLYVDQASLRGITGLKLHDGQGHIQGHDSLRGETVELTGLIDVGLLPGIDSLSANVGGTLQRIDVDGRRMELVTVVPAAPVPSDPNLVLAAVLAFVISAWLLVVRLRQARRHARSDPEDAGLPNRERRAAFRAKLAQRSLGEGRMPRALRHATRAVRLAPEVPSHRVLRSVVLQECARQTGRQAFLREAEREEAKLNRDLADPHDRACVRVEATELLCRLGRREEALETLRQAADDDVAVVVRSILRGGSRMLWDEPWVRALRSAAEPVHLDPAFS